MLINESIQMPAESNNVLLSENFKNQQKLIHVNKSSNVIFVFTPFFQTFFYNNFSVLLLNSFKTDRHR